jgi:hypothetical protein
LAQSNLTGDGTLVYKKLEVAAVKENAAKQKLCLFQSDMENDELNAALGNPQHTGRIRGVGSQISWKHDFLKDYTSYKKGDRYRKILEEKVNTLFENRFMAFI